MSPYALSIIMGLAGMAMGLFFGGLAMYFSHRRRVLWHETARIALQHGQPIPEPPPDYPNWVPSAAGTAASTPGAYEAYQRAQRWKGYLIAALINVAVGLGLFIGLRNLSPKAAFIGAVPAFIGLALLLAAWIEALTGRNRS